MIMVGIVLVLLQVTGATPTPSSGMVLGRVTPIPAGGGTLQDLARKRKDLAPGDRPRGSFSVVPEGSVGLARYERLTIRPVPEGLLFEGSVINARPRPEWVSLELFAKKRNGSVARELVFFDAERDKYSTTPFRHVLRGGLDAADPAALLPDTAGVRVETCDTDEILSVIRERTAPYGDRRTCLVFWSQVAGQQGEGDLLEIHLQNNCPTPVRAVDTWFRLNVMNRGTLLKRCERFGSDVPALGELRKSMKIPVERGANISIVPY